MGRWPEIGRESCLGRGNVGRVLQHVVHGDDACAGALRMWTICLAHFSGIGDLWRKVRPVTGDIGSSNMASLTRTLGERFGAPRGPATDMAAVCDLGDMYLMCSFGEYVVRGLHSRPQISRRNKRRVNVFENTKVATSDDNVPWFSRAHSC
jgi:hypothetical protein